MRATAGNTGPGAYLTDGEALFEVTEVRRRAVRTAGPRRLTVEERRLLDAARPADEPGLGRWVPMVDVLPLEVVRPRVCEAAAVGTAA